MWSFTTSQLYGLVWRDTKRNAVLTNGFYQKLALKVKAIGLMDKKLVMISMAPSPHSFFILFVLILENEKLRKIAALYILIREPIPMTPIDNARSSTSFSSEDTVLSVSLSAKNQTLL